MHVQKALNCFLSFNQFLLNLLSPDECTSFFIRKNKLGFDSLLQQSLQNKTRLKNFLIFEQNLVGHAIYITPRIETSSIFVLKWNLPNTWTVQILGASE